MTPASRDSIACRREYSYADALGKPVLPIIVAEGVSTNTLPSKLSQLQCVDYRQRNHKTLLRLARALSAISATKPLPNPLPTPPPAPISYLVSLNERIETRETVIIGAIVNDSFDFPNRDFNSLKIG